MPMSPALAEVLRGGRAEFNRRFAIAQARYRGLDPAAFSDLVGGPLDEIAAAVARVDAGAVPTLVDALYDMQLALLGQRWIGTGGRAPAIVAAWLSLARTAPKLFAQQPAQLATALANAMAHWSGHDGGDAWLQTMTTLAERARTPDELLRAGQVAAWRHGMAHYRDSALERARALDRELLALAFGVPLAQWQDDMLLRLHNDRWYRPDVAAAASGPRITGRVGAFVGFGGRFPQPPLAALDGGELVLQSAGLRFSVHADAFGATLQATADGTVASAQALPPGWRIDGSQLIGPGIRQAFVDQGAITSAVANADTLLLTHAYAHSATLLALR